MADIPEPLRFAESLLNSVDAESGADDLESLSRFRHWLADHDREPAGRDATEAELRLVREVRDELRALLLSHHDGVVPDIARLDALAATVPFAARFDADGGVRLAPADTGVRSVLGEVLAAIVRAGYDGSWQRLKICSSDSCRYVYYDRSKNSSRRWCSMEVCGNRHKTKEYRLRQRATPPEAG